MSKKEKQIYTKGIIDTLFSIVTLSFYSYIAMQMFMRVCY